MSEREVDPKSGPSPRWIILDSAAAAVAFLLLDLIQIYPAFTRQMVSNTEEDCIRITQYLADAVLGDELRVNTERFDPVLEKRLDGIAKSLGLWKIKVFRPDGLTVFSTQRNEMGRRVDGDYFHVDLAGGKVLSEMIEKKGASSEGTPVRSDVVETYVPIIDDNGFRGALEIYYDVTDQKAELDRAVLRSAMTTVGVWGALLIVIAFVAVRMTRVEAELRQAHGQLEARVTERTLELNQSNSQLQEAIGLRSQLEQEILESCVNERRRIAQDLHDGLGQHLAGVSIMGNTLAKRLRSKDAHEANSAKEIADLIREAVSTARKFVRGLFPVDEFDGKLGLALHALATNSSTKFSVDCEIEAEPDVSFGSSEYDHNAYRIIQEAISNAVKHGSAKRIRVQVREVSSTVTIEATDNGSGFDPETVEGGGLGMNIMRNRAAALGGTLSIESRPGGPTIVRCEIPVVEIGMSEDATPQIEETAA